MIRNAFTLVELLVVVAIISLLLAILLPSLQRARESAILIQCMTGQRQVGAAFTMYAGDYNGVIPGAWTRYTTHAGDCFWDSFYRKTYLPDANRHFRCPKMTGGTYGMNQYFPNNVDYYRDVVFAPSGNGQDGSITLYRMANIPRPADFLLLADNSAGDGGPGHSAITTGMCQFYWWRTWAGGAQNQQALWLAHPTTNEGTAAGMFADNHVEICASDRLYLLSNPGWGDILPAYKDCRGQVITP